MFYSKNSHRFNIFSRFPVIVLIIILFFLPAQISAQQNTFIEISGGIAKSQSNGFGTMLTISTKIEGNFYLTASTGYIAFNNYKKDYSDYNPIQNLIPLSREKFIIPFEVGGLIEFGRGNFRPYLKFGLGYNYTEYYAYGLKEESGNKSDKEKTYVVRDFRTHIASSFGLGMGASYFLNEYMKIGINFMMNDITNINRYVRLMAGVSYYI